MVVQVTVPDMGESIIEATVARWIKQEGESVRAGEPVVELETDKVNLEVGASQAGVLQRIEKQTGETVNVGDVLAWVAPVGESGEESSPATETKPAAPQPAESAATHQEGGKQDAPGEDTEAVIKREVEQDAEAEKGLSDERITPLARRMAEDLGVDLSQVTPTGTGGRITKEDVKSYLERPTQRTQPPDTQPVREQPRPTPQPSVATQARPAQPAVPSTDGRPEERIRMTRRRQTIARRLVEAQQTAAMLTTFNEVDMSAVIDLRKRRRENFKEKFGVDLGFMPFFIKASIGALKAFPYLNAEIQNEEIVLKQYYDIGIAVGAEEGLVVPVIRNADRMSFAEIERTIREFINRSREGTLTLEDLRGGTFTITNGGVFGSLLSTPILNPPQVGILGMHRIQERPVVINGEIVIRPMMYIALSYDHRIVDGRVAVQFLVRLKELVEDPEALLLG